MLFCTLITWGVLPTVSEFSLVLEISLKIIISSTLTMQPQVQSFCGLYPSCKVKKGARRPHWQVMCLIVSPVSSSCLKSSPGKSFLLVNDCAENKPLKAELAMVACSKGSQQHPWLHQAKQGQQVEGGDAFPPPSAAETCVGAGLTTAREFWINQIKSSTVPQRSWRDWSISDLWRGWESWECSIWRGSGRSYQQVMGWKDDEGMRFFSNVSIERNSQGVQIKNQKIPSGHEKTFSTVIMVKHWNGFPRKTVKSPFVEMFKTWLDAVLGTLMKLILLEQGFGLAEFCNSRGHFQSTNTNNKTKPNNKTQQISPQQNQTKTKTQ